jgi:hypothetical protein
VAVMTAGSGRGSVTSSTSDPQPARLPDSRQRRLVSEDRDRFTLDQDAKGAVASAYLPSAAHLNPPTERRQTYHSERWKKNMIRTVLVASFALVLAACGEAADLQQVKQGALDLGGQALEAASGAVDTKTACMLAGQTEAFCGCVQDRLGSEITGEHLEALETVVSESLSGEGLPAAIETAGNIDAPTREALVQCATTAAVEGALSEAGN